MQKQGSLLGATSLVAGTVIGAGMLALPVATGKAGFFPSLLMIFIGWGFMTLTGLFLAEITLWMEEGVHIVTIASRLLGRFGKWISWLLFLFVSYASLVAYTSGCGDLVQIGAEKVFGITLSPWLAASLFALLFGFIIYLGNVITSRVNTLLVFGLVISYFLLIGRGLLEIDVRHLFRGSWGDTFSSAPLLLTIFSFQTIVPSLTLYLHRDIKKLRKSIILGTTIGLVVYLFWQALVMGTVVYEGEMGLAQAFLEGKPATQYLCAALKSSCVEAFANFFAFFALVTSFLGFGLALFDFLADWLKIERDKLGKLTLIFLVIVPSLICALTIKRIFLLALDVSGGIGDAILNGLIPAMMLYVGRYKKGYVGEYRVGGGRPLIFVIMVWALFVFMVEILGRLGIVCSF